MNEEPSFSQIAELFQLSPDKPLTEAAVQARRRAGRNPEESNDLGRQSLVEGDFETAVKHFKKAIEQRGKQTPEDVLDLGAAYEYGDQIPQAYRMYRAALADRDSSPELRLGLAEILKRSGRGSEAIENLQALIEKEPENSFYRIKLAEALREQGYPKKALAAAQDAVLAKPDEAFYHYWVGDLMIQLGRFEDALESLRAAIELSPGDDFYFHRAAVAFWRVGRKAEAIKAIRLASDLDPSKKVYHGLLETMLEEVGDLESAALETPTADKMDDYDLEVVKATLAEMGIG